MTDRMTPNQLSELPDDLLETVSAGLDVMEPSPGCPPEDDGWWLKRQRQAGLPRSLPFQSHSPPQAGFFNTFCCLIEEEFLNW